MTSLTCWRFRRQLTCYADGELPVHERRAVERHLAACDACQQRVRIEDAVRRELRQRTARGRSTAWLTRPDFAVRPLTPLRYLARTAAALAVVGALAYSSRDALGIVRVSAIGIISDSHCNGEHRPSDAANAPPSACVQGCIRKGASYVFVAGDRIYTVRNQDFADLEASAGRTVEVSGSARGTELTLASVAPLR
jgi:hypothetical protein